MNYKGLLFYNIKDGDDVVAERGFVPVQIFEVLGGADRSVKLDKTDDISVSSELEQARTYKNITLYLPPTKDGTDMEIALQMTSFFNLKTEFEIIFAVERFSGGTMLESLAYIDSAATLRNSPYIAGKQLLTLDLDTPSPKLYRGKIHGSTMTGYSEM